MTVINGGWRCARYLGASSACRLLVVWFGQARARLDAACQGPWLGLARWLLGCSGLPSLAALHTVMCWHNLECSLLREVSPVGS
jgi:hypothetical protein